MVESKHPSSYEEGILRLIPPDDPQTKTDATLAGLSYLRKKLEEVNEEDKVILLDRVIQLTPEEIHLLEKDGFRRGRKLFHANWATPAIDTEWAELYELTSDNYDDKYANWVVTEMIPDYPDANKYKLICIKTNPDYGVEYWEENINSRYDIGLVTPEELNELKATLHRFADNL